MDVPASTRRIYLEKKRHMINFILQGLKNKSTIEDKRKSSLCFGSFFFSRLELPLASVDI